MISSYLEHYSHIVNLLINIPADFFEELLTPVVEDDKGIDKDTEYDGKNMEAINVILEFLDHRLRTVSVWKFWSLIQTRTLYTQIRKLNVLLSTGLFIEIRRLFCFYNEIRGLTA